MNLPSAPKVSVYVPSQAYGQYLRQCLDSLLAQSYTGWELLLIDDGSQDETAAIAAEYVARWPGQIRSWRHAEPQGLRACANRALLEARGEYLMRVDADDWLDPSALLVLVDYLDRHRDAGLVYPNWTYVDAAGRTLATERRLAPGVESEVLDLPAHGACTLVRRRVLLAMGGYDLDLAAQDGHELWLRALQRHGVGHVSTPLFFYRQHDDSISRDEARLLAARRSIKQRAVQAGRGPVDPRIGVLIPVKNDYPGMPNLALAPLAGRALLDYTLDSVVDDPRYCGLLVTSDDAAVVAHCQRRGLPAHQRDARLSEPMVYLPEVYADAAARFAEVHGTEPDVLVILSVHTPLRRREHIHEAIDSLLLYPVDQVLSTWEDHDLHYRRARQGMQAVNASMIAASRLEREALYACNGSIHVLWREFIAPERFLSGRIGHVVMTRVESLQAKKAEERQMLELLLSRPAPP